jgi:uncharacterized protein involved in type VI secretion and phage assembly
MLSELYWSDVVDNVDPDGLNRVKVSDAEEEDGMSDWMTVLTPYGSPGEGVSFTPEIGAQVLVTVVDGVTKAKVVIGSGWSNEAEPPETEENSGADLNQDGNNSLKFVKSRSGNEMIFDDTEGEEKIQIISADKESRFELSDADEMVSLETSHDITLGAEGTVSIEAEEVEITSEGPVNVSADEYQIASDQTMVLEADDDLSVKGSSVGLN